MKTTYTQNLLATALVSMPAFITTGVTPAMSTPKVGNGSIYPTEARDSEGNFLDSGRTYSVTLPKKSDFVFPRLYGPLEPRFDKTWKPDDFKLEE